MEKKYILDSIVRQAVERAQLGEFKRSIFSGKKDDVDELRYRRSYGLLGGEQEEIRYTLEDKLTVVGYCFVTHGIRKKSESAGMMTEEGIERYRIRAKKQSKREDAKYERDLAAWRKKTEKISNDSPFKDLGRPLLHEGRVDGKVYGVLVDSYKDKEWYTARLDRVIIQYIHPDAVMNLEAHKKATDLTGEALLRVMEQLKARYAVETGYLNGRELHNYSYDARIGSDPRDLGPKPKEEQNNIFQREFKEAATVDEIATAIKNVYAAGEAFNAGIDKLRKEKKKRHEEALEEITRNF